MGCRIGKFSQHPQKYTTNPSHFLVWPALHVKISTTLAQFWLTRWPKKVQNWHNSCAPRSVPWESLKAVCKVNCSSTHMSDMHKLFVGYGEEMQISEVGGMSNFKCKYKNHFYVCVSVLWCERVKQRLFPAPSFPLCQTYTHTHSLSLSLTLLVDSHITWKRR